MAEALLNRLGKNSPRVELYRVSATDVTKGRLFAGGEENWQKIQKSRYSFFNQYPLLKGRGTEPFVPATATPDMREVIYSDGGQQLFQ